MEQVFEEREKYAMQRREALQVLQATGLEQIPRLQIGACAVVELRRLSGVECAEQPPLGEIGEQRNYSDEVAKTIDEEVRAIIDKAYERATDVLTVHRDKLIALAAVIYACWQFSQVLQPAHYSAILIALLVVSALGTIALFATGGLMSAKVLDYSLMLIIHRIAPVVLALALGSVAYLIK